MKRGAPGPATPYSALQPSKLEEASTYAKSPSLKTNSDSDGFKGIKWEENEEGRTWTSRLPAARSLLLCTAHSVNCTGSASLHCALLTSLHCVQLRRTLVTLYQCAAPHLSSSFAQWLRACRGAESSRKTLWSRFCLWSTSWLVALHQCQGRRRR